MPDKRSAADSPARVLLLGGTSEIGLAILAALGLSADTEVLLAGRDEQRMAAAAKELGVRARTLRFDATALDSHQALIDDAFAGGDVDLDDGDVGEVPDVGDTDLDVSHGVPYRMRRRGSSRT